MGDIDAIDNFLKYCVSVAALDMATELLDKVHVNSEAPTYFKTAVTHALNLVQLESPELSRRSRLAAFYEINAVVQVVLFFLNVRSKMTTRTFIAVDGGHSC